VTLIYDKKFRTDFERWELAPKAWGKPTRMRYFADVYADASENLLVTWEQRAHIVALLGIEHLPVENGRGLNVIVTDIAKVADTVADLFDLLRELGYEPMM